MDKNSCYNPASFGGHAALSKVGDADFLFLKQSNETSIPRMNFGRQEC